MRPVLINDLIMAALSLLALPAGQRDGAIRHIVQSARFADLYRKRTGRSHKTMGNGTLASACQSYARAPMPHRCNGDYLACMMMVLTALTGIE